MKNLNSSRSGSSQSVLFLVFRGPEEDLAEQSRRLVHLVDIWLKSRGEPGSLSLASSNAERKLHQAIKAGPLYGKVLSFAGLNLWVDDRTLEGFVEFQEAISL